MAEDLILIISIVAALAIGVGGGLFFSSMFGSANKRAKVLEDEVDKLKRDQAQYREQVSQHFQKTANLFQDMTEQYKTMYTHLAEGAEQLCSGNTSPPALDLPEKPRLAEQTEDVAEAEMKAEATTAAEEEAQPEPQEMEETPNEEDIKAAEKAASSVPVDDDNMLGDAPNIPDLPADESDKPKIH